MRKLVALFAAVLSAVAGYSQSGSEVLCAMADKVASIGSYRVDFELEMPGAAGVSKGECRIAGESYVISIEGMMQGSDGVTLWVVDGVNEEVMLDAPRTTSRSLFDNPTKAFDFAEELFEIVSFESASPKEWELQLRPAKGVLDGIDVVELRVDKTTLLPTRLGYDMAGAGLYVNIRSLRPEKFPEESFQAPKPEGYEVIDFR